MKEKLMLALDNVQDIRSGIHAINTMADGICSTCGASEALGITFVTSHIKPYVDAVDDLLTELFKAEIEANKEPEEPTELPFVEPQKPGKKKDNDRCSKPVKREKIDHGKIIALHKAGWSSAKIADEMGCSNGTVSTHIKTAREKGEL